MESYAGIDWVSEEHALCVVDGHRDAGSVEAIGQNRRSLTQLRTEYPLIEVSSPAEK